MQASVIINKISKILYILLYYLLQRESQIIVLMRILHQHLSRNQVLGNQCVFTNILDVQPKTAKRRFVAAKSRRKSMKVCNSLWKKKRKGHSKINDQIKRNLYTWITRHPQVVQSPISNYCLKVVLDDQTEPQLVPKFLLQVSVIELHNSLVSDPNGYAE